MDITHPATVNPDTDPEPPKGTVLAIGDSVIVRIGGRWGGLGFGGRHRWGDCGAADWTVLRWGREGSAPTETPTEREAAPCGPSGAGWGTTTPESESDAQRGTQGVTLATGTIDHLTIMTGGGVGSVEVDLSGYGDADQFPRGRRVRIVAEDCDEA